MFLTLEFQEYSSLFFLGNFVIKSLLPETVVNPKLGSAVIIHLIGVVFP